mmetsp:Transcript_14890/g.35115  ORF Transcript_14890/g.35115 Transcript_14890/m.35115 type:complete len:225 (+) Transcript_14890:1355-2029(+)
MYGQQRPHMPLVRLVQQGCDIRDNWQVPERQRHTEDAQPGEQHVHCPVHRRPQVDRSAVCQSPPQHAQLFCEPPVVALHDCAARGGDVVGVEDNPEQAHEAHCHHDNQSWQGDARQLDPVGELGEAGVELQVPKFGGIVDATEVEGEGWDKVEPLRSRDPRVGVLGSDGTGQLLAWREGINHEHLLGYSSKLVRPERVARVVGVLELFNFGRVRDLVEERCLGR